MMNRTALLLMVSAAPALSQGTDQPPAQRDLMVIERWLPGAWDSVEQAYFEGRRNTPGGNEANASTNPRQALHIARTGPGTYSVKRAASTEDWTFTADPADPTAVRLTSSATGCDIVLRREAGQFAGTADPRCKGERHSLQLAQGQLWEGRASAPATRYRLARSFTCYVDIPGVGGGRAVPSQRYGPFTVLDQGGEARFATQETPPRNLSIRLRNVAWPYNNAPGIFTRNSLTLYVSEHLPDQTRREIAYSWGEPTATRMGLNLKQLLVNCAMVPLDKAEPEF